MTLPKNLLLTAAIATMAFLPFVTRAQAPGAAVTVELVTAVKTAEANLLNLLSSQAQWSEEYVRDSGEFQAALGQLTTACTALGNALEGISGGTWGARVYDIKCGYGSNSSLSLGSYGLNTTGAVDVYLTGMANGVNAAPLTQERFNTLEHQEMIGDSSAASAAWDGIQKYVLNPIIVGLGNIVASIIAFVATGALALIEGIVQTTTNVSQNPRIIDRGWTIIRDFMNLVFILALIIMALATILKQEKYAYRALLPRLIIMALLINFSKVIAETLIGVSDSLILMFAPNMEFKDIAVTIFQGFITGDGTVATLFGVSDTGTLAQLAAILAKIFALVVMTISLVALAGMFVIRMIGLWFLIMLSPAAYALRILPGTSNLSQMWWSTFLKYLIWGPVAMFFIRLAIIFIQEDGVRAANGGQDWVRYLIIAGFMWGAFWVAKNAGMYGSSGIISLTGQAAGQAKNLGYMSSKYMARGTPVRHVGQFVENRTGYTGLRRAGTFIERQTAKVEAIPRTISQPLARSEARRQSAVDEQSARLQERRGLLGNFDKDTIKQVRPVMAYELSRDGNMNADRVTNMYEHGSRPQKEALALSFRDGHFDDDRARDEDQREEFRRVREIIRVEDFKMRGGKEINLAESRTHGSEEALRLNVEVVQTGNLRQGENWADVREDRNRFDNRRVRIRQAGPIHRPPPPRPAPAGDTPNLNERASGERNPGPGRPPSAPAEPPPQA